jgi:hypothetical protein
MVYLGSQWITISFLLTSSFEVSGFKPCPNFELDIDVYSMIYFQNYRMSFIYDAERRVVFKLDENETLQELMKADHGIFPGKNLKKDFEENNLYVQTGKKTVTICLDIDNGGFGARMDLASDQPGNILEFIPLGRDKLVTLSS